MKPTFLLLTLLIWQQPGEKADSRPQRRLTPSDVILQFAAKEAEFRKVWEKYTYRQNILIEVLGPGKVVESSRTLEVEVYFNTDGERKTRLLSDRGELKGLIFTPEDIENATELQPFVLTTEQLPHYAIDYLKQEHVDELDTYVFDVRPRHMEKGKRYFLGRIWVDMRDLQIVMSRGRVVPEGKQRFPTFETVRSQVDGEYWFPVWAEADEDLLFDSGQAIHLHQLITYGDFQKFEVTTGIRYEKK